MKLLTAALVAACLIAGARTYVSQSASSFASRTLGSAARSHGLRRQGICSLKASAGDDEGTKMMKSLESHMEQARGTEAFPDKTADDALHAARGDSPTPKKGGTTKVLGSKRLGKIADKLSSQEEMNLQIGFHHLVNELKGLMGSESFSGAEAEKALREAEDADNLDDMDADLAEKDEEELRFLGSRRLYRLKRKATQTVSRPHARKNHPGETVQQRRF